VYTKAITDAFDDEEKLKELGMEGLKVEDLHPSLRGQYLYDIMDLAALSASASGQFDSDTLTTKFLWAFKDDFEFGAVGSTKKPQITKRMSPAQRVGVAGLVPGAPITKPNAERFIEQAKQYGLDKPGQILGYTQDAMTALDGTVQVTMDVDYAQVPVDISGGRDTLIPKALLGPMGLVGLEDSIKVKDGPPSPHGQERVWIRIPKPGGQTVNGVTINSKMLHLEVGVSALRWHEPTQSWQLRRALGVDPTNFSVQSLTPITQDSATAAVNNDTQAALRQADEAKAAKLATNHYRGKPSSELAKDKAELTERRDSIKKSLEAASPPAGQSHQEWLESRVELQENFEEASSHLDMIAEVEEEVRLNQERVDGIQHASTIMKELIEAKWPMTMTQEEIETELAAGNLPTNTGRGKVLKEALERRKRGIEPWREGMLLPTEAPAGAGMLSDDALALPSADALRKGAKDTNRAEYQSLYNEQVRGTISKFVKDGIKNGTYNSNALTVINTARNVAEAATLAKKITQQTGGVMDTALEGGNLTPYMLQTLEFIKAQESFEDVYYADPGLKSQKNIGYGFSLDRGDSDEILKAAGTSLKEVLAGKPITEEQAKIISSYVVAKNEIWIRKKFAGIALSANKKIALHSFIYSSRWAMRDGILSPTVLGPTLEGLIKSGNHGGAARLIANTTRVADPSQQSRVQKGMEARRRREANMYLGVDSPK
jgi:GH24 family phage-related lysozyme (muramidase)